MKPQTRAFTVALVGPDGVGKTTIARRLEAELPLSLKYLYMGDNVEACNVMLPTTRWWKRRRRGREEPPPTLRAARPEHGSGRRGVRQWLRVPARAVRKTLGFVNRLLEVTYRELVASFYFRRGTIVVFDRHFVLDYYHFDIDPQAPTRGVKRRLHAWFLRRCSRPPDLVVCLDAPGEVVFRRKGEFGPEYLEMRRRHYRDFQRLVDHFALVDANRDLELVVDDVAGVIQRFHREHCHGN